jgi:hypothetical protein
MWCTPGIYTWILLETDEVGMVSQHLKIIESCDTEIERITME